MQNVKQQSITYQFSLINYDNPFEMASKIHSLIFNYQDLVVMEISEQFELDPTHLKNGIELLLGDIIPAFVKEPHFLNFEMTKEMNSIKTVLKILNELDVLLETGIEKKQIIVRMIHKWQKK